MVAILDREPDWSALPKTTPSTIRRLLRRCLEKDPKRRLRDIGDAQFDLDDASPPEQVPASNAAWRETAAWIAAAVFARCTRRCRLRTLPRPHAAARGALPGHCSQARRGRRSAVSPSRQTAVGIAFVGVDAGGQRRLWVRPVDSLERAIDSPGLKAPAHRSGRRTDVSSASSHWESSEKWPPVAERRKCCATPRRDWAALGARTGIIRLRTRLRSRPVSGVGRWWNSKPR